MTLDSNELCKSLRLLIWTPTTSRTHSRRHSAPVTIVEELMPFEVQEFKLSPLATLCNLALSVGQKHSVCVVQADKYNRCLICRTGTLELLALSRKFKPDTYIFSYLCLRLTLRIGVQKFPRLDCADFETFQLLSLLFVRTTIFLTSTPDKCTWTKTLHLRPAVFIDNILAKWWCTYSCSKNWLPP